MLSLSQKSGISSKDVSSIAAYLRDERSPARGIGEYMHTDDLPAQWAGAGAARLGLSGRPEQAEIEALLQGYDPSRPGQQDDPLIRNAGPARVMAVDATLSAPKSVSVLLAVTQDPAERRRIEDAVMRANAATLERLERDCWRSRSGHATKNVAGPGGTEMIASSHMHMTSRAQDPDLHIHNMLYTVAYSKEQNRWTGVDSREVWREQKWLGAAFRSECAKELAALGYHIDPRAGERGFGVAGITEQLERQFSKRAQVIELAAGPNATPAQRDRQVLATRPAKTDIDAATLRARWLTEARQAGFLAVPKSETPTVTATEIDSAKIVADLTRQRSTFAAHDAMAAIADAAPGLSIEEIDRRWERMQRDQRLVALHDRRSGAERWTTREMMALERRTMARLDAGRDDASWKLRAATVNDAIEATERQKGFAMDEESRTAIAKLTTEAGDHACLVGVAGAGKSTAMSAIRTAYEIDALERPERQRQIVGCAPSGKAAAELEKSSGIKSATIHSMLGIDAQGEQSGRCSLPANGICVVDEAGMIDSRTMAALVDSAKERHCKLLLVGDPSQLSSVGAGGLYQHMIQSDPEHAAYLLTSHRQRDKEHAAAVAQIRAGQVGAALDYFIERGQINIAETREQAIQEATDKWYAAAKADGGKWRPESAALIASTNADIRALNEAARAKLLVDKRIVGSVEIQTERGPRQIGIGERLIALRNDKETGLKNGQSITVVAMRADTLTVRVDGAGKKQKVVIDTTRYNALDHGYASTVHKAQGGTVQRAVYLAGGGVESLESTYVALSRSRLSTELVFDAQTLAQHAEQAEAPQRTIARAEALAEAQGIEVPAEARESLRDMQSWISEHQPAAADRQAEMREQLKDVAASMSRSRAQLSTLDYEQDQGEQEQGAQAEAPAASAGATQKNQAGQVQADREKEVERDRPAPKTEAEKKREQEQEMEW